MRVGEALEINSRPTVRADTDIEVRVELSETVPPSWALLKKKKKQSNDFTQKQLIILININLKNKIKARGWVNNLQCSPHKSILLILILF